MFLSNVIKYLMLTVLKMQKNFKEQPDRERKNRMGGKIKVSIIIPVYNVEKYLEKCLTSVVNQTLKDIEIICINDGSTDNSADILQKFGENDSRIKIIHQKNQKQGAARNRGLDIAQGEFIAFADADDWIDEDYLEKMYNACIENEVNAAVCSHIREKQKNSRYIIKIEQKKIYYYTKNIVAVMNKYLNCTGKIYRRECIQDLRFRENVYYEDAPYAIRAYDAVQSLITVPDTCYHYRSNPDSTIKCKQDLKHQYDKIINDLAMVDWAENNNINSLKDWVIIKEHPFWGTIKRYKNKTEYYLYGIKVFSRKTEFKRNKIFLVFNTACVGDVLLCNSLCQNIKRIYPESYVVFIVNKPMYDAAKYQKDVDDVVIYDKKGEHKGLFGFIKFLKNFKYKNAVASFITYKNVRNYAMSIFLGAKHIFGAPKDSLDVPMQKQTANLAGKDAVDVPIKYEVSDEIPEHLKNIIIKGEKYIGICTLTKGTEKDIPIETAIDLIKLFNNTEYEVIFTGLGEAAENYAQKLKAAGCKFIDCINKTTIPELGSVIKNCAGMVSADTGTMHLSCAVGCPVAAVFYIKNTLKKWAPDTDLYKSIVISENQTPENIFNQTLELLKKEEVCNK